MRNLTLTAVCLMIVASMSAPAVAQQGQRRLNQSGAHAQSHGDKSDAILRQFAKEVAKAHQFLARALPIYDGHRVSAMQECRETDQQIAQGLKFDRKHEGKAGGEANVRDNDSAAKYGRKQVERSNAKLKKAADILANAKGQLERADHDYDGHRVQAIKEIDEGLGQIRAALRSVTA